MKKRSIAIILAVALIALLAVLLVLVIGNKSSTKTSEEQRAKPTEYLIRSSDMLSEKSPRLITKKDVSDNKSLVINYYDGYQIEVPSQWEVPMEINPYDGLRIHFGGDYDPTAYPGIEDGILLKIRTFEGEGANGVSKWVEESEAARLIFVGIDRLQVVKLGKETAYEASTKLLDDYDLSYIATGEKLRFLQNSALKVYVLDKWNNIYVISCVSKGDQSNMFVSECDKYVSETFAFLADDNLLSYTPFSGSSFDIENFGVDSDTGKPRYVVNIKLGNNQDENIIKEEVNKTKKEVEDWITSKGVDPNSQTIDWVVSK